MQCAFTVVGGFAQQADGDEILGLRRAQVQGFRCMALAGQQVVHACQMCGQALLRGRWNVAFGALHQTGETRAAFTGKRHIDTGAQQAVEHTFMRLWLDGTAFIVDFCGGHGG